MCGKRIKSVNKVGVWWMCSEVRRYTNSGHLKSGHVDSGHMDSGHLNSGHLNSGHVGKFEF